MISNVKANDFMDCKFIIQINRIEYSWKNDQNGVLSSKRE